MTNISKKKHPGKDDTSPCQTLKKDPAGMERHEKAFNDTIREIQNRYEYVINNISEIIFQTDKEGYFTFLNSVWDKVTGFSFEESIGNNLFEFIDENDREGLRREFYHLSGSSSEGINSEVRLQTRSRGYIWVDIQMHLTYSSENILLGTTGTISDIDAKKEEFF